MINDKPFLDTIDNLIKFPFDIPIVYSDSKISIDLDFDKDDDYEYEYIDKFKQFKEILKYATTHGNILYTVDNVMVVDDESEESSMFTVLYAGDDVVLYGVNKDKPYIEYHGITIRYTADLSISKIFQNNTIAELLDSNLYQLYARNCYYGVECTNTSLLVTHGIGISNEDILCLALISLSSYYIDDGVLYLNVAISFNINIPTMKAFFTYIKDNNICRSVDYLFG